MTHFGYIYRVTEENAALQEERGRLTEQVRKLQAEKAGNLAIN